MAQIKIRDNESLEKALKRFKTEWRKTGVIREAKKRQYYEKPSEMKKRKKAERRRNKKKF